MNRTATALDEFYHQWGYRVDRTHAVSADHMAVELTFLAQLWGGLQRERDEEGPQEAAVQDALRQFVEEHVGFWAPGFFRDVAREAATPEYRLVGQFGQRLFPSAS